MSGTKDPTDPDARRLADLALVLSLELATARGAPHGDWLASSHEAALAIAAASYGAPSLIAGAAQLLGSEAEGTARRLLIRAEIYAAFWGD